MGVLHEDEDGNFWVKDDATGEVTKIAKAKTTAATRNAFRAALPGKDQVKIEPEDPNAKDTFVPDPDAEPHRPLITGGGFTRRSEPPPRVPLTPVRSGRR